jgi:hypothetical protein
MPMRSCFGAIALALLALDTATAAEPNKKPIVINPPPPTGEVLITNIRAQEEPSLE